MRKKNPALKQKIYDFVNEFYRENNIAPSFKEISDGIEMNKSLVYYYVLDMSEDPEFNLFYENQEIKTDVTMKCSTRKNKAPLVGSISCGDPTAEIENIKEYIDLPESIFGTGDFYILKASGDSMVDAGIFPDDMVVIDKSNLNPSKGDIIVVLNEFGENTLKLFDGFRNGKPVIKYMNEAKYPGKTVNVDTVVCQGIARHVIKELKPVS